jgi:hypothetical protein
MNGFVEQIRYGRTCPICSKPVELRLITYGTPFRCQNCGAMLDISSFYERLSQILSVTVAFLVLWKVIHFDFWFAAFGSLVVSIPLRAYVRAITKPLVPLEPSDVVG